MRVAQYDFSGPLGSDALLINGLSRYWTRSATRPSTKVHTQRVEPQFFRADKSSFETASMFQVTSLGPVRYFYLGLSRCRRYQLRGLTTAMAVHEIARRSLTRSKIVSAKFYANSYSPKTNFQNIDSCLRGNDKC